VTSSLSRRGLAVSAIGQTGQSEAIHSPEAWASVVVRLTIPTAESMAVVLEDAFERRLSELPSFHLAAPSNEDPPPPHAVDGASNSKDDQSRSPARTPGNGHKGRKGNILLTLDPEQSAASRKKLLERAWKHHLD
jgi:hypothetical protein